jgi:dTDP-4-dehydrorhamnose reductase
MQGLLVFGRTGQVARELALLAPDARFLGRDEADLLDIRACTAAIRKASVVINAAAYTAVDRAESEPDAAYAINSTAPAAIARCCHDQGIPFLHISTDYVFDGIGDIARDENAVTRPLNVYGASKLAGEQAVIEQGGQWAILRTSWVFSAHGNNFLKTMCRLGDQRDHLKIVMDQVGGPTPAADIAAAILIMARAMQKDPTLGGLYHFAGYPDVSWAGFAQQIFLNSGISCDIESITTAEYPTPAKRPLNSRLDCRRISRDFGIERPDWRTGVIEALNQLEQT